MSGLNIFTSASVGITSALSIANALGYLPPQWVLGQSAPVYVLDSQGNMYFFDAILRATHNTTLQITRHPVQSGADITDHAYREPEQLMMEVGMSDAMASLIPSSAGLSLNKSVDMYQSLKAVQYTKQPVTVYTRFNNYTSMLIRHMSSTEDWKTQKGGRFTLTFQEIILAPVGTTTVATSSNPQATDSTNAGNPQSQDVGGGGSSIINNAVQGSGVTFDSIWSGFKDLVGLP